MSSYFMLRILKRKRLKAQRLSQLQATKTINNEIQLKNYTVNSCRICLNSGTIPIFSSEPLLDLSKDVNLLTGIQVSQRDPYPKYLCSTCYSLLQGAILLRKSAQGTDKLLRQTPPQNVDTSYDDVASNSSCGLDEVTLNFKESHIENLEESPHKNLKQNKNVRIQCPICHRLLTAHLYKRHLNRHQMASHLICEVCGKLYRKDNLVRHLQMHSYDLPFQCQVCPYRGRFMESLKIHMRTHSGQKPFTCDKCELRFITRSNLNRHLLTHKKEKLFKCIECGRGLYTKRDMDVHFKSDHTGVKDFGCRVCGNKYGTRKALMRHELRVHKRDKMAKGRMPLYLQPAYRKADNMT